MSDDFLCPECGCIKQVSSFVWPRTTLPPTSPGPKMHCLIIGQPGHPHWLPLHRAAEHAGFAVYSANKDMPPRIYCKKQWREFADDVCRSVGAEPWVRTPMPKQWGTAVVTEDIVEV